MNTGTLTADLLAIYGTLYSEFGHQQWWPADTPFEIMVGAVLAQNVSWENAAQAVENLKSAGMLDPVPLAIADTDDIARLIIPSRFFNQKAERIQKFSRIYLTEFQANPATMAGADTDILRRRLLSIRGFGDETVDTILLYACGKPIFVVDAYTRRIFSRYGLLPKGASYSQTQHLFAKHLPPDTALFNDYHAQIVQLGKITCKKRPLCDHCPIRVVHGSLQCATAVGVREFGL